MNEMREFIKLSKYAGERFDLIQAGGGNLSVKLKHNTMLIKASGFSLSEVGPAKGYVKVNNRKILGILNNKAILNRKNKVERERWSSKLLKEGMVNSDNRPSIETFMHALLYKYTLHTHPVAVTAITGRKDWRGRLSVLFTDDAIFVDYKTPGVELALQIQKDINHYLKSHRAKPRQIFLQNHGLIVSSDYPDDVIKITEKALKKVERYLGFGLQRYKVTNRVSALVNSLKHTSYVAYLSSDTDLAELIRFGKGLFDARPFSPDMLVYCGMKILQLYSLDNAKLIRNYYKRFNSLPRVIVYKGDIFFIAEDLKKARETEEVLKGMMLALDKSKGRINYLDQRELSYLSHWEAERYRQRLCR